jgi:hypothetical protein
MQTRLCSLNNKIDLINGLALEPVIIKKPEYLSLFPDQKKVICAKLKNEQIRKENGVLVGPVHLMNNYQIVKKNVVEFNYEDNCDTQLLIKYKPLIKNLLTFNGATNSIKIEFISLGFNSARSFLGKLYFVTQNTLEIIDLIYRK